MSAISSLVVTHLIPWAARTYGPEFRSELRRSVTSHLDMLKRMESRLEDASEEQDREMYFVGSEQVLRNILTILDAIERNR